MLTLKQQPRNPNASQTKLVYNVSASNSALPQYQYVADIYDETSTTLYTRVRQYPNPDGEAVFELSRPMNDRMSYRLPDQVNTGVVTAWGNSKFRVYFGEEYGTSPSSSVTLYDGYGNPGDPDLPAAPTSLFKATKDPNNPVLGFNFDTSPFQMTVNYDVALTDDPWKVSNGRATFPWVQSNYDTTRKPFKLIGDEDYETIPVFNNLQGDYLTNYVVSVYDGTTLMHQETVGLGAYSGSEDVVIIGSGPENLRLISGDLDTAFSGSWDQYSLGIYSNDSGADADGYWYVRESKALTDPYSIDIMPPGTGKLPQRNFEYAAQDRYCNYERTRFVFINKYGQYDFYNVWSPVKKMTKVGRETITRPFVDYSSEGNYNIQRRGKDTYFTQFNDTFSVTTCVLEENVANWLTQLIESPQVYIEIDNAQQGSIFARNLYVPINITNSSYDWNTNPRSQKMFQYTIEWEYSNQRYSLT